MLKAIYELTEQTGPIVDVQEARGQVRFQIARTATAAEIVPEMNREAKRLCEQRGWLQLWDGGVSMLSVCFELKDLPRGVGVDFHETGGVLHIYVQKQLSAAQFVDAMNPATKEQLAGGQLYQCWQGEIISNASPEESPASS